MDTDPIIERERDVAGLLLDEASSLGIGPNECIKAVIRDVAIYENRSKILGWYDLWGVTTTTRTMLHSIAYAARHGPLQYRRWLEIMIEQATVAARLGRNHDFLGDVKDELDHASVAAIQRMAERVHVQGAVRDVWTKMDLFVVDLERVGRQRRRRWECAWLVARLLFVGVVVVASSVSLTP